MNFITVLFSLFLILQISALQADTKKIVILTGDDHHHASGTHEFYAGGLLIKDSLEKSNVAAKVSCEVINNWAGDLQQLQGADAIVHYYKGNDAHLMKKNFAKVDSLAKAGVSQLFVHYAVDPCVEAEEAVKYCIGGVYKDKFSTNPHWTLNATLKNHPINTGVKPYEAHDEWYVNMKFQGEVMTDYERPNIAEQVYSVMHGDDADFKKGKKVKGDFAKRVLSHSELTVMWAQERKDGGRGVGFTGAHYHKNWAHDELRKQVLNAIVWAVKLPLPAEGVMSPQVTEEMINANLDPRKKGGLKKITLAEGTLNGRKVKKEVDPYKERKIKNVVEHIHPYFSLENINTLEDGVLKVGGMCFHENALYIVTLSPDRMNKNPGHQGELLRLDNVISADGVSKKIKHTVLAAGLYEPTGVAVVGDSVYVGTKTQILRFDGAVKAEGGLKPSDATVMLDGLSTDNFHTYTVGFEQYVREGKTYLCGNFTTAIVLGGKRATMRPPNEEVKRGSTFLFGPVTGAEAPEQISLEYLAGGYRTPNGIEVGPENEVYVADNQGIFNPSNELIRVKPGSFYGHYLLAEGGKRAAFQPEEIDSVKGSAKGQTAATVHLPQSVVARSPAQPHVINGREGILAPYNGQVLLCDFTTGSLLRIFTEEVEGVWQGAVFKHSGGVADEMGNNGFTAGPNRLEEGPDGHYYIGQIGAGGLWEFNGERQGLQRLRVRSEEEVDAKFNEILATRVVEGGFELEFLKPVSPSTISLSEVTISQWTYFPTSRYGGAAQGQEKLKAHSLSFSPAGKKATLLVNGLKDGSEKYVLSAGGNTSDNTGWVVHVNLNSGKTAGKALYTDEFWYTLHRKVGGKDLEKSEIVSATAEEVAKQKYESLCVSCHAPRGNVWAAPDLKGILGRQQTVIRDREEVQVTVDRAYLINAIINPESEKVVEYKDAVMAQMGIPKAEAVSLVNYIIKLK